MRGHTTPPIWRFSETNSMCDLRLSVKLLPNKLILIRLKLNVNQREMHKILGLSPAVSVSQYETGSRVPSLMDILAYARLGNISMESLADDDVDLCAFRKQLGR